MARFFSTKFVLLRGLILMVGWSYGLTNFSIPLNSSVSLSSGSYLEQSGLDSAKLESYSSYLVSETTTKAVSAPSETLTDFSYRPTVQSTNPSTWITETLTATIAILSERPSSGPLSRLPSHATLSSATFNKALESRPISTSASLAKVTNKANGSPIGTSNSNIEDLVYNISSISNSALSNVSALASFPKQTTVDVSVDRQLFKGNVSIISSTQESTSDPFDFSARASYLYASMMSSLSAYEASYLAAWTSWSTCGNTSYATTYHVSSRTPYPGQLAGCNDYWSLPDQWGYPRYLDRCLARWCSTEFINSINNFPRSELTHVFAETRTFLTYDWTYISPSSGPGYRTLIWGDTVTQSFTCK
jgi:hypothetical protein